MKRLLLPLLLLVACIPDFDLEQRAYLCEGCTEIDSGVPIEDCRKPDAGSIPCDDNNVCTRDICQENGECVREDDDTVTGGGWICQGGRKVETSCNDTFDNEGDGARDCLDADCPKCESILNCCNGFCLPVCQ